VWSGRGGARELLYRTGPKTLTPSQSIPRSGLRGPANRTRISKGGYFSGEAESQPMTFQSGTGKPVS